MRCVYCLEEKTKDTFNREHVIPRSFGRFEDNFVLNNAVCKDCNKGFGEKLELFLGRDSFEGIERLRHGIKSKGKIKRKGRISSRIKSGERKNVIVTTKDFSANDTLQCETPCQVGFYNKWKDEYNYYQIEELPTKEEAISNGFDVDKHSIFIIAKKDELGYVHSCLSEKGFIIKKSEEWEEWNDFIKAKQREDDTIEVETSIDDTILRGVSKIVFNYAAYTVGARFLMSDDFNGIRNFIRYGNGRSIDYCVPDPNPVLFEDKKLYKFGAKTTRGHLIVLTWRGSSLIGKISFFNTTTYHVNLCNEYSGIWLPISHGHLFDTKSKKIRPLVNYSNLSFH